MSAAVRGRHAITYWTGVWEPTREAISKQVAWLRSSLAPGSPVVSFTAQPSHLDLRNRVARVNVRRWYLLRTAVVAVEPLGRVSHVFGGIGTTNHFLHVLRRRPILFTVVVGGVPGPAAMYKNVRHFVAESRPLRDALVAAGVARDRIDLIHPAVDLSRYTPAEAPSGPFTLLFASSPPAVDEIEGRGIGLLIELARARPDITIRVLWRQWGEVDAAARFLAARRPPDNFVVERRDAGDMAAVYRSVHATVCLFEAAVGKSAPNSVIEGLASGRPSLVSDTCGIADVIEEWHAGVVSLRSREPLIEAVTRLQRDYARLSGHARALAEAQFDRTQALTRYDQLYGRLTSRTAR